LCPPLCSQRPSRYARREQIARRGAAMEASSLPMLTASRFLSPPPPPLLTPTCSRQVVPFVRAAAQTLEAPEAPKPPRPSPRRSAVAEVKASSDPVAALNRYPQAQAPFLAVNCQLPEIVRISCGLRDW
jgi:hypothetical protein